MIEYKNCIVKAVSFNKFLLLAGNVNNLYSRYSFTQDADGIITVNVSLPPLKPQTLRSSLELLDLKCQNTTYRVMETDNHVFVRQENPQAELKLFRSIDDLIERNRDENRRLRKLYCSMSIDKRASDIRQGMLKSIGN